MGILEPCFLFSVIFGPTNTIVGAFLWYCCLFVSIILWYCWLFVSIVLLQFDSQSPSLCSNDSFSFLIFFFNYFDFFIHFFYRMHWFSFFVFCWFFFWLCIFFVVLLFVSSSPSALLCHSFFSLIFTFFLFPFFFIFSCLSVSGFILSLSFDFGYYIGPFLCFLLLFLFHAVYYCGKC